MGNPVDLRVVSDVAEIVANIATFNSNAADHVETAKKMLTQTSNWVFVADKRLFGPSKFCGFSGMDFLRYARAQQELRSNFDGGRTRRGIEKTIGLAYEADDGLAIVVLACVEQPDRGSASSKRQTACSHLVNPYPLSASVDAQLAQ